MGGHHSSAPQADPNAAMMAMIQQQNAQIAAEQAAAQQAQINAAGSAQQTSAQSQAAAGNQAAQQFLGQQSQVQAAKDAAAASANLQAMQGGANASAGGFNLGNAKSQAASNLGAAQGTLPGTPANQAGGPAGTMNPAATTAAAALNKGSSGNQILPPTQGITFGGN